MANIIQLRRDTAANWTSANPILAQGEIGIETDTRKLKIGNAVDVWADLDYYKTDGAGTLGDLSDIDSSTPTNKNFLIANGVNWDSRALIESDISDFGDYYLSSNPSGFISEVGWNQITGTQNSVSLSGFNNDLSYEVPLTFSTGLTRTGNIITNNITQLSDLSDVVNTGKAEGKILKVNAEGNHVYVTNEGGTDEKVKIDEDDLVAGYLNDKLVAGSGVSLIKGTGDGEGTLIIANTDKGSDVDLSAYTKTVDLNMSNWDTAYGWGNHADAGYLTQELDTLQSVTDRGSITDNNITVASVTHDEEYIETGTEEIGTTFWDSNNHCLTTVYEWGAKLQHGFELFTYGTDEGNDFPEGSAVSVKGAAGNRVALELTDCANHACANNYIGLITTAVNGPNRIVTREGRINGINTSSFDEGDMIYVDPVNPGQLTNVFPSVPHCVIRVGTVTIKHATEGAIDLYRFITPTLKELSDINGTPLTEDGQILTWHNNDNYFDFDKNINDYKTYSGFENQTDSVLSIDSITGIFTLAPAITSFNIWTNGTGKHTLTTTQTVTITEDQTITYVYIDNNGTLQKSLTPWDLSKGVVAPCAIVFKDNDNYALTDERHGYERNRSWHNWAHFNIGSMYKSGLSGTFTNTTLSVTQGLIYDEDLRFDTGGTKETTTLWYRNATNGMRMIRDSTTPYYAPAGVLQFDAGSGIPQAVGNNRYTTLWVYASNDAEEPIYTVLGQNNVNNLNSARNATAPIINLSTAEWKLLYRTIYRNQGGTPTFIEAADFRNVQTGVPASAISPTSHSLLTDRELANSHPSSAIQYDNTDGVTFTNVQNELERLENTSGNNTGDQTSSDFDIKDLSDSTSLRTTWSGKQDALVSGTNIKTINNNDITGSGNVSVGTVTSVSSANTDIAVTNGTTTPTLTLNSAKTGADVILKTDEFGKIDQSVLPAIAISETFVVASEVAQLALTVQKGDVAIRTDESKTYINATGNNTAMSDWEQILFPSSGTGTITSVTSGNGMNFSEITTSGSVTMGTPSTLTNVTTNTTTTNSHTHQLDLSGYGYITGVNWNQIGGTQNSVSLSGFNNDLSYEVPLTFSTGLTRTTNTITTNDSQINHNALQNYDVTQHRVINDDSTTTTDLWSAGKISTDLGTKAASSHTHGNITNTGAIGTTANLPLITGTSGLIQASSFGTSANTFCQGNDSRLSDARTPTNHNLIDTTNHPVTGLTTGHYIRAAGANSYAFSAIQAADVPTLNQNTTGQAGRVAQALTGGTGITSTGTYNGSTSRTFSVTYGTASGTACQGNDARLSDARTPTAHTHGQISNTGAITTAVTVATGDRIIVSDASDSNIIKSGTAFGTSTSTYLRNDGVFETPPNDNTTYLAGTGITLTGTTFSSNDSQINHNALLNYNDTNHRAINDAATGTTDLWSASKINTDLGTKQATLVSGTNIKTINSTTLLGAGDLAVGTVTSVNNGNGMNFTDITGSGTVTLGTPSTLTASTTNGVTTSSHTHEVTGFLPLTGGTLTGPVVTTTLEIGNASDTTLSRVSAGKIAVEGVNIVTISSTDTLTNKTIKNTDNIIQVGVEIHSVSDTLAANECYGKIHYVSAASTLTLPAVADGMNLTIITIGAVAVSVDPNSNDKIWLDGTALDDGDKITNLSKAGDIAVLTYYSADGWHACTNSWTDGGA